MRPFGRIYGSDGRRGIAMLIGIMVLAALFFMALPFAVFMRQQHSSATQALQMTRAHYGESGAIAHAKDVLYNNYTAQTLPPGVHLPFPWYDTALNSAYNFHVTLRTTTIGATAGTGALTFDVANALGWPNDGNANTVDGYIRVGDEWMAYSNITGLDNGATPPGPGANFPRATVVVDAAGRGLFGTAAVDHPANSIVSFFPSSSLWSLDIQDQQALINVNTAPYQVILNLLGYAGVGGVAPGAAGFPTQRQQYLAQAIVGYKTYATIWRGGTTLAYTPFEDLDMVKNSSVAPWFDLANPPLSADDFDRLRPYLTVTSAPPGGSQWTGGTGVQTDFVTTPAGGGETNLYAANLADASRFGVGTLVRFTWVSAAGTTPDIHAFATVLTRNSSGGTLTWPAAAGDTTLYVSSTFGWNGASPETPGYIRIDNEWIRYTGVTPNSTDPGSNPCSVVTVAPTTLTGDADTTATGRGCFGTTDAAHAAGATIDGDVITWRWSSEVPPVGEVPLESTTAGFNAVQIEAQVRDAININTVTDPITLEALLYDVSDGTTTVSDTDASTLAHDFLNYTSGGDGNYLSGNENWFDGVDPTGGPGWGNGRGELANFLTNYAPSPAVATLLEQNFDVNAPANWPRYSTLPLQFNSGSLIGIDSLASIDDQAGMPVAEAPYSNGLQVARVYQVVPPLQPVWWSLRTQEEFVNDITSGNSKNVRTALLNDALPAATLLADTSTRYTNPALGFGTVRPAMGQTNSDPAFTTVLLGLHNTGLGGPPPDFALDYSRGSSAEAGAVVPGVNNTTDGGITNVDLQYQTDYNADLCANRNIQADSFQATMQPFAFEAWIKMPDKDAAGNDIRISATNPGPQLLVDIGGGQTGATAVDQARLYVEYSNGAPRLMFRMDDETGQGYVVASSSNDFTFSAGCWYHVNVAAVGTFRNEMAMIIDGIYDSNMGWEFNDGTTSYDSAAVQGSYFWPIAMRVPNKQYKVAIGPGVNFEWVAGSVSINLVDATGLPQRGMIVIHHVGGGTDESHMYEYYIPGPGVPGPGSTLTLVTPLQAAAYQNNNAACAIPLVQTTVHQDAPALTASPQVGDSVRFYEHARLSTNPGGYDSWGYPTGNSAPVSHNATIAEVGTMADPTDPAHPLAAYKWIGFDPDTYNSGATGDRLFDPATGDIYAGETGFFDPASRRWKVLNAAAGTLSGELPCYPGATFRIGGSASGTTENFRGSLDEVRLSVLPVAMPYTGLISAPADWAAGDVNVNVDTWAWAPDAVFGPRAEVVSSARLDLADELATRKLPDGGYFAVENDLYDFDTFAGNLIGGVGQQYADLVSNGTAGPVQTHELLKRLVPLDSVTSTRLAGAIAAADTTITLADVSAFPDSGYVKIDNEVLAYNARDGALNTISITDPAYRRGCYNTTAAGHAAATTVELLPVREVDRYRATDVTDWDHHTAYGGTVVDDATSMAMLSWVIPNSAGAQVSNVEWTLKDPLSGGQKVAVLVNLDTTNPLDDWGLNPTNPPLAPNTSTDSLWGTITQTDAVQTDQLYLISSPSIAHPTAITNVEVRVYFDLSGQNVYNHTYNEATGAVVSAPHKPLELDSVSVELVPQPAVF
jgi:hypothetical protein